MQRAAFGEQHAAVVRVDAHSRPAIVGKTVCIHTDGLVNHSSSALRFYMPRRAVISGNAVQS